MALHRQRRRPRAGWWTNLPLRRKGLIVVALPVLSVVTSTIVFLIAQDREQEAEESVTHTLSLKNQLDQVMRSVLDVESGARGFIITGEEVYFEPFRQAEADLPGQLDELERMVGDDPDQADRVERLRGLIEERVELAGRAEDFPLLTTAVSPALAEAVAEGSAVTQEIREVIGEMDDVEDDLLAARRERAQQAGDVAVRAAVASLAFGVLGGVVASLLFSRGIARRLERLQEAAGDLVAGEPVDPGPAARDEVGRVAADLERSSHQLAEARRSLEDARAGAEAANRSKSEFLSRMSHELRTPLNAVLGFAQLLEMEELDEEQTESVREIIRGGRHLLDLINEVLDIARIESGRLALSPEPVLVDEVVSDSMSLCRPLAADRQITLVDEASCAEHVQADRQRLKQVLLNLIGNAVKYNRRGGSVRVGCAATGGERLRIEVHDTGAGIPEDQLDLLFAPFERLGAEQTGIEGSGVGLTLSQHLAEAMGGALGVESRVGEGSTFWVELPVVAGPEQTLDHTNGDEARADAPPSGGRHTVVHIEDNAANLRLVERVLSERSGVEVVSATSGEMGLEVAAGLAPDLILLDLHLPDMDGEDVLRRLRDLPETADAPVVVVSADATPGQIRRLLSSGATGYVTKPIDVAALLDWVDRALAAGSDAGEP